MNSRIVVDNMSHTNRRDRERTGRVREGKARSPHTHAQTHTQAHRCDYLACYVLPHCPNHSRSASRVSPLSRLGLACGTACVCDDNTRHQALHRSWLVSPTEGVHASVRPRTPPQGTKSRGCLRLCLRAFLMLEIDLMEP